MSLSSLLTPARLRTLAGEGYARGERYWRSGRVVSCERDANGITGIVAGSQLYKVRVLAHDRALASQCTCPVGGAMCKHAVALALSHLAEGSGPQPVPAASEVFATRAALEAWAAEHQVEHELDASAQTLQLPEGSLYWLSRWSLRDLGSVEGAQHHVGPQLVPSITKAVTQRLERAASEVRAAIEAESRPRPVPGDAALLPLWERLVELRGVLRKLAPPRGRVTGSLTFDGNAIALRWQETRNLVLQHGAFSFTPVVSRVALVPSATLGCTCRQSGCTHMIALIDAALDVIADPARATEALRLADELLKPPWQRVLAELDVPVEPRVQPIEVWWLIDEAYGEISVAPLVKKERKKGGLTGGARITPQRLLSEHARAVSDEDRAIAQHLTAGLERVPFAALAALVDHPRVARRDDPARPITVERLRLGFAVEPAGDEIRVEPALRGEVIDRGELARMFESARPGEPLLLLDDDRCVIIDVGSEARRVCDALARHGSVFPPESHAPLLEKLAGLEGRLPLAMPETLMGVRIEEEPVVVMRLRLLPDGALEIEPFIRVAAGAPLFPPGIGPRAVLVARPAGRGYVKRDFAGEHELTAAMLARLPPGSAEEGPPGCYRLDDVEAALAFVAAVAEPPPGLEAEWVDRRPAIVRSPAASKLSVKIQRKRDWFGIVGELDVADGRVELAVLLDAARRQRRFVRLDDNRWLDLSEALRRRLQPIADQTFEARDHLELSPGAVPAIRELADAGAEVETPPAWQLMTERLASVARLAPAPPATLAATLRPYQIEGHAWLTRVAAWGAGACLADDMGLGKTVQAIAVLIDRARLGPALVIAPTSVTLNWVDELRRFAPTLRPIVYGQSDRADVLAKLGKQDVLVVSYGLLARDADKLAASSFATLVLDEAQALKNPATRRAKAARTLTADLRIALSGTPLENHLGELWSLFAIVFPGLLGSWEQFRQRYALPIERDRNAEARAALSRVIRPFLLRRTKQEVARELPARTEIPVSITLSAEEKQLYEDARLAALAKLGHRRRTNNAGDERQRFEVLAALTRLRLCASHPRLYDPQSAVASSKMQRLLELVDELRSEGHRALIFSQFTSHLAIVRDELTKAGFTSLYLDGQTPLADRADRIRRFQAGEADLFLLSLKAGGTGINLTAADYVIHLDPWWNPAVEDQATDRAHRIGQAKPVTVYRLIARGTVEEQIVAMHGDKRALVAGVLDGTDVAARLTTRDLLALLQPDEGAE